MAAEICRGCRADLGQPVLRCEPRNDSFLFHLVRDCRLLFVWVASLPPTIPVIGRLRRRAIGRSAESPAAAEILELRAYEDCAGK